MSNTPVKEDDLVERLERQKRYADGNTYKLLGEAAGRIRRLRGQLAAAEVRNIESECCREDTRAFESCAPFDDLQKENEALKSQLASARKALEDIPNLSDATVRKIAMALRRSLSNTTGEKP